MLNRLVCISFLLLLASQCLAQIGLVAGYKTFNPAAWNTQFEATLNETPYAMPGWQVGLDYWFRLKKRRIEFAPEVSVARFQGAFDQGTLEHLQAGLHFNTDIYVLDLAGDCNCPTFSKDGNFFSKGFFVELGPGVVFVRNKIQDSNPISGMMNGDEFAAGGSIGAGLDLGFSDLFTLTPIARFHYYPGLDWNYSLTSAGLHADLKQLFLGLRLRLHFKEFAKARYR